MDLEVHVKQCYHEGRIFTCLSPECRIRKVLFCHRCQNSRHQHDMDVRYLKPSSEFELNQSAYRNIVHMRRCLEQLFQEKAQQMKEEAIRKISLELGIQLMKLEKMVPNTVLSIARWPVQHQTYEHSIPEAAKEPLRAEKSLIAFIEQSAFDINLVLHRMKNKPFLPDTYIKAEDQIEAEVQKNCYFIQENNSMIDEKNLPRLNTDREPHKVKVKMEYATEDFSSSRTSPEELLSIFKNSAEYKFQTFAEAAFQFTTTKYFKTMRILITRPEEDDQYLCFFRSLSKLSRIEALKIQIRDRKPLTLNELILIEYELRKVLQLRVLYFSFKPFDNMAKKYTFERLEGKVNSVHHSKVKIEVKIECQNYE